MFRLSKGADYAIRSMVYVAGRPPGEVSYAEEISRARDVPLPYLSKLLQHLAKRGLLKSYRGREGGFILARPGREITLLEIIEAIEGPLYFNDCLIKKGFCSRDRICSVHSVWKEYLEKFMEMLRGCSIAYLVEREFLLAQKRTK